MRVPIVSSTHWDREWRFSFQQTRAMLVELMDHLIEILDKYPEFKHYHLDAQTVVLEDYLEIRPERREDLKRLITQGRILVGPWYTLPDMCSIGGEAIIRNLLFGHKKAKEFGKVMKVGYTPTGFGQIAQLPQIYAGFGIDTILFYRGADRDAVGKEFLWEASDGSKTATYIFTPEFGRMPLFYCIASNYYRGKRFYDRNCDWSSGEGPFHLNDNRSWKDLYYQAHSNEETHNESIKDNIKRLTEVEMKKSCMDTFLLLDGVDSTEPQPLLINMIEDMNKDSEKVTFYHASMEDFADKLRKAASKMSVYRGEMRTSAKYGTQVNLMGSAISSRIYLKQLNDQTEKILINWAEPFSTFAWTMGERYPDGFLSVAWKYLFWNQSHDAISGCSQDIVHKDMEYYFRQSLEISDTTTNSALFRIATNISSEGLNEDDIMLVVYNPLPFERSEIVQTSVDIPEDKDIPAISLEDHDGNIIQLQVDSGPQEHPVLIHCPKNVPGIYRMKRWEIRFMANKIPSMGYKTFLVKIDKNQTDMIETNSNRTDMNNMDCDLSVPNKTDLTRLVQNEDIRPETDAGSLGDAFTRKDTDILLENEYISVHVNNDGTFNIKDKRTGRIFKHLNQFEDSGEAGDPWIRREPEDNPVIMSPLENFQISVTKGEVTSSVTVAFHMEVPEESDLKRRSGKTASLEIETTATLDKGMPWLSFRTAVRNNARDHRLRVLFPSGIQTESSFSEAPFEIMKRKIKARDTTGWFEQGYTTYPQRGFAAVTDGRNGLAVLNKGLPEYEVMDDAERTIAITLLRCYKMFVPKLKTVDITQIGSQCLGEHVFDYAVCPFEGDLAVSIQKYADAFGLPMKVAQSGRQLGCMPIQMSFLQVTAPLMISAVKKAESRNTVIVRLYNPLQDEMKSRLDFYRPVTSAYLLDMEEQQLDKIEIGEDGSVVFNIDGKKILTLEIEI